MAELQELEELETSDEEDSAVDLKQMEDATAAEAEVEVSQAESAAQVEEQQEEEEEQEECGFCLFMKGGPCGQRFSIWQGCVEGAEKSEKDIVKECSQITTLLKVCMEMNPEYYGPVLEAEKAMEAEVYSQQEGVGDEGDSTKAAPGGGQEEGVKSKDGEEGRVEAVDTPLEGTTQVAEAAPTSPAVHAAPASTEEHVPAVPAVPVAPAAPASTEEQVVKNTGGELGISESGDVPSDGKTHIVEAAEVLEVVVDEKGQVVEVTEIEELEERAA